MKHAGLGLFTTEGGIQGKRTKMGSFGGKLLCGLCTRRHKRVSRKMHKKRVYDTVVVEKDHGMTHEKEGVFWHIARTGNTVIDGSMWYINSSRPKNIIGYREPNVQITGRGFFDGGDPAVEVITLHDNVAPYTELLADYMSN